MQSPKEDDGQQINLFLHINQNTTISIKQILIIIYSTQLKERTKNQEAIILPNNSH